MKKLLVVLLSLGLIVAFSTAASAVDVKFSGGYYVVGAYENNRNLVGGNAVETSRAFFYQRVRIQPVFVVAEGLTLTTRFDALEKQWGNTNWRTGVDDKSNSRPSYSLVGSKAQENIEFERGYVGFKTAIALFEVGYMGSGTWGTTAFDNEMSRPRIKFTSAVGPMTIGGGYEKTYETDNPVANNVDADNSNAWIYGIYNWKGGNAGLLYKYTYNNSNRPAGFATKLHSLIPYIKATFGPVYVEGEVAYTMGKVRKYETGLADIDSEGLAAYLQVKANIGPAYAGALYLWSRGDDYSDATKSKTGAGGIDFNPALLLGNDDYGTWSGTDTQVGNYATYTSAKTNTHMVKAFGGYNPTPKLNVELAFIGAKRDKANLSATTSAVSKDLGMELDATVSYKLYDNLTYMVGAAYLWTGDYFKGTSSANEIGNDYLLMNKLTLSF